MEKISVTNQAEFKEHSGQVAINMVSQPAFIMFETLSHQRAMNAADKLKWLGIKAKVDIFQKQYVKVEIEK